MTLQVKVLDQDCTPYKGTELSTCIDLRSRIDIVMSAEFTYKIPLGVIIKPPEGFYTQLVIRSGMAVKGVDLVNSPGIIDSDYCGPEDEVCAIARYIPPTFASEKTFTVKKGDRICQILMVKREDINIDSTYEPKGINRNGFGSTGIS